MQSSVGEMGATGPKYPHKLGATGKKVDEEGLSQIISYTLRSEEVGDNAARENRTQPFGNLHQPT